MAALEIHQYAYDSSNYGVLLHDTHSGQSAAIDAGDADAALAALGARGWSLNHILITHHHADHTAGLAALKDATGAEVIGPGVGSAIAGLDHTVQDGDELELLGQTIEVIHTPGHTLDMMNYYWPQAKLLFSGDTLFLLGCGRVFEGDMTMMWQSLSKYAALPADTEVYCGHEMTQDNARFALTIDPDNAALIARAAAVEQLRSRGQPTVPGRLDIERQTNPFLRAADPGIRRHLGMIEASDAEVFAEIRRRKDRF